MRTRRHSRTNRRYRRLTRPSLGAAAIAAFVCGLAACAPPSDDLWTASTVPIAGTPVSEGVASPPPDVQLPMMLADDTAGGVWGTDGGLWRHYDASGLLLDRFDFDADAHAWQFAEMDVVSDTVLLLTRAWSDDGSSGQLVAFDIGSMSVTPIAELDRAIGALATAGETAVLVSHDIDDDTAFSVERVDLATGTVRTLAEVTGIGATADLDVDGQGRIYLATEDAEIVLSADGATVSTRERSASHPRVAVSAGGNAVWMGGPLDDPAAYQVREATDAARTVIARYSECDTGMRIVHDGVVTTLDAFCGARGVAWRTDDVLVVSIGDEGGAPLIELTPPVAPRA